MAKKYYAVKKGKTTGIFHSWDACKAQVDGFSCAEYKSFLTEQEALSYMGGTINNQEISPEAIAYVDGSYDNSTKEFSYGMIILKDGEELKFAEKFKDPELSTMRNVAGEIMGARAAMQYAMENGIESIAIYHDYIGISKWCLGEWKTNKEGTRAYKAYYDSIKEKITITFVKVAGHSNDKYNDIADELAKQALGLIGRKHEL